eukprot:6199110-Pleurochrysis_carterae.AAC.1
MQCVTVRGMRMRASKACKSFTWGPRMCNAHCTKVVFKSSTSNVHTWALHAHMTWVRSTRASPTFILHASVSQAGGWDRRCIYQCVRIASYASQQLACTDHMVCPLHNGGIYMCAPSKVKSVHALFCLSTNHGLVMDSLVLPFHAQKNECVQRLAICTDTVYKNDELTETLHKYWGTVEQYRDAGNTVVIQFIM